jgi:hypothetical protein
MTPPETTTARRALKSWQRLRILTGAMVIVAAIATAVYGLGALGSEQDASRAMKLPFTLALFCLVAFVHAQKKILALTAPNQLSGPASSQIQRGRSPLMK